MDEHWHRNYKKNPVRSVPRCLKDVVDAKGCPSK